MAEPRVAPIGSARASSIRRFRLTTALLALVVLAGSLELVARRGERFGGRLRGSVLALPIHQRITVVNRRARSKLDHDVVHTTNSLGFRGPEPPGRWSDATTLITVGGSTTQCYYLTDGRTWTDRLAALLGPAVWVNNAGLDGASSSGHLVLMRQLLSRIQPRFVAILVGLNDLAIAENSGVRVVAERPGLLGLLTRHSAFAAKALDVAGGLTLARYGIMHDEIDFTSVPMTTGSRSEDGELDPALVGQYENRLREILTTATSSGIHPILITQPALFGPAIDDVTGIDLGRAKTFDGRSGAACWSRLEQINDRTRASARASGAVLIDLAREMPKSSRYYYDWVHFTNEGAAEVARLLAPGICAAIRRETPEVRCDEAPAG